MPASASGARRFVKKAIEIRGFEQVQQEIMSFFERLKTEASDEWRTCTEHPFIVGLADGTLPETAFRHYLVQDYLFLIAGLRVEYPRRRGSSERKGNRARRPAG
jgi:thiaminase/transcriptional activator TenA